MAESTLSELRRDAVEVDHTFPDPAVVYQAKRILAERGESWAESVAGRQFHRRSVLYPQLPWLHQHEPHLLVWADGAETLQELERLYEES